MSSYITCWSVELVASSMWRIILLIILAVTVVNINGDTLSQYQGVNDETDNERTPVDSLKFLQDQLECPEWEEVIKAGGMHVGSSRNKRFVELTDNPQPNIAYQACTMPTGKTGHCRHLQHCIQEEYRQDFVKFMDYLCVIQHKLLGACCPDDLTMLQLEGPAGDLPATAPKEEQDDVVLKITRAENRGCGLSTRAQGRLVGSRPADPREWPWMASVTPEGYEQYCGGVLITDRHVLTAAHCTRSWLAKELFVRLGEYDMKRSNDSRTYNFRVVEKRQHESFDNSNNHHDIAILKLHRPAVFNTYVWPICLPPVGLQLDNQTATIIGWGAQWYRGPSSDVLMEVSVPVWPQQSCVDSLADSVFEETLCAGGREGGRDACQGDSGGPLMYQMSSGRWATIGVVSWGIRCGEPAHPGVYARIDKYLRWIVDNARF